MKQANDSTSRSIFFDCAIPLLIVLLAIPFAAKIDLAFASYFYNPELKEFSQHPFFAFIYVWGIVPGQILGIAALIIFLLSYKMKKVIHLRKPALVIGLTIAIGAGIITHAILKDHWQRPRPRQVEQFGGSEPFRPFYKPNFASTGKFKSFPSGHCAMGFCFFALTIIGRRRNSKILIAAGIFTAILLGSVLSITRIAQGGHFFSDTLTAACLMWITAAVVDKFLYSDYCPVLL